MAANSLQELFLEELRDTYDGEKRLTKDGLVTRRYGQLVVTDEARRLLGMR